MNFESLIAVETVPSVPVFGAIGSLWFLLVVIVGSALVDWLKKRAAASDATGSPDNAPSRRGHVPSPPASAPVPAPTPTRWEEDLRRLLGVEPPPVAKPPPIPPVAIARPRPVPQRKAVQVAPPREPASLAKIQPEFVEARRVSAVEMPGLLESGAAFEQAARLTEQVARQMKLVDDQTERHLARSQPAPLKAPSEETAAVISLLRARHTARQAVIASVILASPKGLAVE